MSTTMEFINQHFVVPLGFAYNMQLADRAQVVSEIQTRTHNGARSFDGIFHKQRRATFLGSPCSETDRVGDRNLLS